MLCFSISLYTSRQFFKPSLHLLLNSLLFSLLLHICMFAFVCAPYFSSCLSVFVTKNFGFELLLGPGFLHFTLLLLQQLNWEINYETSLVHFLCALANISCPNPLSIQWHCGLKSKKKFILLLSENVTLNLC